MKRKGSNFVHSIDNKRKHWVDKWEETSNVLIGNFLEVFGADGRLSHWFNEKRAQVARAISPPASPVANSEEDDSDDDEDFAEPPAKRRAMIDSASSHTSDRVGGN